jgi:hypothetical protein
MSGSFLAAGVAWFFTPITLAAVALFVVSAVTGCVPMGAGPGNVPNAPYPQDDMRDTAGMH